MSVSPLLIYRFRLSVYRASVPCIPLRSLLTGSVGRVRDPITWERRKECLREGYAPSSPYYTRLHVAADPGVRDYRTGLLNDTHFRDRIQVRRSLFPAGRFACRNLVQRPGQVSFAGCVSLSTPFPRGRLSRPQSTMGGSDSPLAISHPSFGWVGLPDCSAI